MALKSLPGEKTSDQPHPLPARTVGLWLGLLAGPTAAFADVAVSEAYVEHTEAHASRAWLLVFAVVAVLVCAAAARIAWRSGVPGEAAEHERIDFMAKGGVAVSLFSILVVLAELVPKLVLGAGGRP
jgi:hypothetical protein